MSRKHWAADWAKRIGKPSAPIKVIRLPGFKSLEDRSLWEMGTPDFDNDVNTLSLRTFGITVEDTYFPAPMGWRDFAIERQWEVEQKIGDHEARFPAYYAGEDQIIEQFKKLGFDFTDDHGKPLRILELFCRQAEAAARGIAGRRPEVAALDAEIWGNDLEEQARQWKDARRR